MTLNPCKVCGERELLGHVFGFGTPRTFGVKCSKCGHEITTTVSSEEAVWLWNNEGNSEALKPCPFCGRAVEIIHVEPSGYNHAYFGDEYAVAIAHAEEGKCVINNLMSFNQREESMMIDMWNRRVKE